jgi:putative transposase
MDRGQLQAALKLLTGQRFRPPGAKTTRGFSVTTLERWYYAYRKRGLNGLVPDRRSDAGRAKTLSQELRQLMLDIAARAR